MLKKGKSKAEGSFSSCIPPAFHINYFSFLPCLRLPNAVHHEPGCALGAARTAKPCPRCSASHTSSCSQKSGFKGELKSKSEPELCLTARVPVLSCPRLSRCLVPVTALGRVLCVTHSICASLVLLDFSRTEWEHIIQTRGWWGNCMNKAYHASVLFDFILEMVLDIAHAN